MNNLWLWLLLADDADVKLLKCSYSDTLLDFIPVQNDGCVLYYKLDVPDDVNKLNIMNQVCDVYRTIIKGERVLYCYAQHLDNIKYALKTMGLTYSEGVLE